MKRLWFLGMVVIYAIFLVFIFAGEAYYQASLRFDTGRLPTQTAAAFINHAIVFNPLNAEYRYQKYFILKDFRAASLRQIKQAIELDPAKPAYHMYYGLSLLEVFPPDKFSAQLQLRLAKKELARAARLKPFSELYQETYVTYSAWIDSQF
jgi:hypothetical protein